jgi:hypothetical protein
MLRDAQIFVQADASVLAHADQAAQGASPCALQTPRRSVAYAARGTAQRAPRATSPRIHGLRSSGG